MSADLRTTYLGIELPNPLVPGASPLGQRIETLRALQDAGAAAVVLPSLFEEQIEHETAEIDRLFSLHHDSSGEATSYFPDLDDYNTGVDTYLALVQAAREAVDVPVIASLNGTNIGGWLRYARLLEDAGADAIELNLYAIAADPGITDEERQTIAELMAKGSYASIILATNDLAGTFDKIQASGADVVQEPADQPYGIRDCAFRDPAGNMVRINQLP